METIPFANLANTFQAATIEAGANGRVFFLKIPESAVGFLKLIGNNWFSNTYFEFIIDGEVVKKVEHQIGNINDPTSFDPPYVVRDRLEFKAYNNSTKSIRFEVVCDGVAVHNPR